MKSASDLPLTPPDTFRLIESDLQEVEACLRSEARSSLHLVNQISHYLHNSGGKRIRPALLLLCSKMCGAEGEVPIRLGAVVELIHVATLVHDDIIDNAAMRRGQPSINAEWGNPITVLMGDWLYMTAFWIALGERNFRILDVLIDITRKMVEGELKQLEHQWRLEMSVEEHLAITERKTAHLFSGCGRLGGILGGIDSEQEEMLAQYGKSVGMAFQLIDDLLDYSSDERALGKPVLKDLEEGKVTLPIIRIMQRASSSEREFLHQVVRRRDFSPERKFQLMRLVQNYGVLDDQRALALEYAQRASRSLAGFPDSLYREILLQIPDRVIQREN